MKKFLLALLLSLPTFAHAVQHIYIRGNSSWYMDCGEPYYDDWGQLNFGPCVPEGDNGIIWAYINGSMVSGYFDYANQYTAVYVAQELAYTINNYAGVPATVVNLDPDNPYPQYARIDIDDSSTSVSITNLGITHYNASYAQPYWWAVSLTPIDGYQ